MNKCEKCGFLHYRTDPCRKPKSDGVAHPVEQRSPKPRVASSNLATIAKSNSASRENEGFNPLTSKNASGTTSAGTVGNEDRRPKFDKTAYQRSYVARWRRGEVGSKHRKQ